MGRAVRLLLYTDDKCATREFGRIIAPADDNAGGGTNACFDAVTTFPQKVRGVFFCHSSSLGDC